MSETVIARYHRHHVLYEEPFNSIDDAIEFLAEGFDNGHLSLENVVSPDGAGVLDEAATRQRVFDKLRERDDYEQQSAGLVRPDEEPTP